MQYSYYNIVKSLGSETLVYNTLTSSFLKIPTSQWNSISEQSDVEYVSMLVKQGILVENHQTEINKYKYFFYKNAFANQVLELTIAPTMRCNFDCPYCFEGDNKSFPKMTEEVENAIIQYIIKKSKYQRVNICWFGGEPLLAFDKICSISSALDKKSVKFDANIITNGSLVTEKVLELLPTLHLTHIQISLDGVGVEHDKTRRYKNGKPSFLDIDRNIGSILSNTSIKVVLRVGVDNTHPDSYLKVYDYMSEKYPEAMADKRLEIGSNAIQNRTGFDKGQTCFSDEQLFDKEKFDLCHNNCFKSSLPGMSIPCMYKKPTSLAIDSRGFIYPCLELLGVPDKSVGNIVKGEISFSKQANLLFDDSAFDDEECLTCNVFPICGGGCPKDREEFKGNKSAYCTFYKKYLADLLPYYVK